MAQAGARGLTGPEAIRNIVTRFERPRDPLRSIKLALANYSQFAGGPAMNGGATQPSLPSSAAGPAAPGDPFRRQLAQALIAQRPGEGLDLLGLALQSRQARRAAAPAAQEPVQAPMEPAPSRDGWQPASGPVKPGQVAPSLLSLAKRYGLQVTSGYRSVAQQASIYANRSSSGSVAKPGSSWHNSGRAIDVAPDDKARAAYRFALAHPHLFKEAFYDPAGVYVKNGRVVKGRIGGHSDHVHFAM